MGIFVWFQCREMAQTDNTKNIPKPKKNLYGETMAFLAKDFTFFTTDQQRLQPEQVHRLSWKKPLRTQLVYRIQKNGDKRKAKTYGATTATTSTPLFFFPCAAQNVLQRDPKLLGAPFSNTIPLSIYGDTQGNTKLLTNKDFEYYF